MKFRPGWYRQPDGSSRYWDGKRWTQHRFMPASPPGWYRQENAWWFWDGGQWTEQRLDSDVDAPPPSIRNASPPNTAEHSASSTEPGPAQPRRADIKGWWNGIPSKARWPAVGIVAFLMLAAVASIAASNNSKTPTAANPSPVASSGGSSGAYTPPKRSYTKPRTSALDTEQRAEESVDLWWEGLPNTARAGMCALYITDAREAGKQLKDAIFDSGDVTEDEAVEILSASITKLSDECEP